MKISQSEFSTNIYIYINRYNKKAQNVRSVSIFFNSILCKHETVNKYKYTH